ncbi:DUF11 domain-containing protein [Ramlibacter sp. G-1-2-2]|uniref:DUF11 domain-containing protein n=1 Tax=Ramlibacter agri TaxID=2728837 RepID=A0A848HBZ9_9BURK|nr:DUF11 domain-containing protein [Ramlibacter agri]NML46931.1 DUF11 domain-containing protein [Ramlibacter agri]
MSRRLLQQLLVCWALLLGCMQGQAAPAAGSVISNTALATFVDSTSGLSARLSSNTVNTRVTVLEALTLSASQNLMVGTGAPFAASHTLVNTGNTDTTYLLTVAVATGSAFTPLNLQVVQDVNGNGRADSGEPVIGATGITLPMGTSVNLLVTGTVPPTAGAAQAASVVLSAVSQVQGARATNTDTFTLTSGAAVQALLSASVAAATPSSPIDWTAVAINNGNTAAGAVAITIDGTPATGFVLRAAVPANTAFTSVTGSTNVGARTLYHLVGNATNNYASTAASGASVDGVAWMLASLPAGGSLQGQFRVTANANAAGSIVNTAYADWADTTAVQLATSNRVVLPLPNRAAEISFYSSSAYAAHASQNQPGKPLFVQLDAAVCNADAARADTVPVTLTSQLTGDVEVFTATETGPNTGLFRILPNVPTANAASHIVSSGDGIMEVLRNDLVTASVTSCGGVSATATTTLLIDPSGVVYDSRSNLPLSGATVQLIDVTGNGNGGRAGSPADVLEMDGTTKAASSVVTSADGVFAFPLVQPSTYKLLVTPPNGFQFPSALPIALQPAGRVIDQVGSYGGSFTAALGPVRFDVPLDTGDEGGMFLQKTASKATAEIGDFVDYTVTVKNVLQVPLLNVVVRDALPRGFAYVKGSARLDGAALADPAGGTGPQLTFAIGKIVNGVQRTLTYRVRVGVGSQGGDGINTAQAEGGSIFSNHGSARVQVVGGVFSNDAYLIGKVYADCRGDGVQADGAPGIPGVRILLEDGTYAVTDEEGKYSLYGLTPRTHVAKVDLTTLPAGSSLRVLSNRNAFDAGSRFVDLKNGELHKADFAVAGCDEGLREQIAARRKALANPAEMVQAASTMLAATPTASATDARTLPASGALALPGGARNAAANGTAPTLGAVGDTGGSVAAMQQGLPKSVFRPVDTVPGQAPAPAAVPAAETQAVPELEDLLPQVTADTGFIGLEEGQVLPTAQTRVRVKGPLGATFELQVNGQVVPTTQVGKRSSLPPNKVTGWEYIGVDLHPGRNTLEVQVKDPFGNVRGKAQVTVLAPGPLATVRIDVPKQPVADPNTPIAVAIALEDAAGLPATARAEVTLLASAGEWQVADVNPTQAGTQVLLEGGSGRYLLVPPAQPGKVTLTVQAGMVKSTAEVEFVPLLRPMIAAGVVEGTINLRNLNPAALQPASSGDVFEREIQSASHSFDNGKGQAGARAAMFLKGKVLGSSLLTVAYDSDKPSDTRLLRDIQPNQFYPVYGDSSARGFDGQSTGKLYVLLQNGTNFALLGDFTSQSENTARQLTQYSRSLSGAKGRWSNGTVGVEAFGSRTGATQVVQEFRGNGTSGPFQLNANGVVNSEQVHVIIRSRDQPALVLKDTALTAFTDYSIEPLTGLLLLKDAVPSVDADLNPVFVRVSYDVDNGGPKHDVAGVEANVQVLPGTTVGAVVVADEDPANRQRLQGLTLTSKLGEKTVLTAEAARSRTDLQGDGKGERFEFRHEGTEVQARVWGAHTDGGFYNPNSPQSAGQSQYGAKAGYVIDPATRVVGEALRTTNSLTGAEQTGAELRLERSLPGNARIEVGVRYSKANAAATGTSVAAPGTESLTATTSTAATSTSTAETGYTSARVKLTVPVPGVPSADVYALAEQAIDGSGGRETGVGANYQLNPATKLYARHDFINSLNGPYTLNAEVSRYTTVAGVTTTLPGNTQVFNEYRMGDAIDGRTSEAALGLRNTVRVAEGMNVTAALQRIKPITGPTTDESSAVSLGVEYTAAADWKASSQAQWQMSASSRSWLLGGAVVNRLDREWTLLNRFLYNDQTNIGTTSSSGERTIVKAQSGVAYRPVDDDTWNALARVEYDRDHDTTAVHATDQGAWILSTHLNVQPRRDWVVNGRYAAKLARDRASGLDSKSFTQLVGARSVWDLNERWDFGVQAYTMWGNDVRESAIGLEIGYLVWKNLWLSAGYNIMGFSARDLAGDATTQKGAYLRMRFKFDETLLQNDADASPKAQPAAGGKS